MACTNKTGHQAADHEINIAATCTEYGGYDVPCLYCGEIVISDRSIPPLGHNYEWTVAESSTCVEHGHELYMCTECEYTIDARDLPLADHSWNDWIVDEEATCTTSGTRHHVCDYCGTTESETITALGHNYVNGVCTRCGESDPHYESCSHDNMYLKITEPPTCTETGVGIYICSDCGYKSGIEDWGIPPLGHDWSDWVNNGDGTQTKTCNRCGVTETSAIIASQGLEFTSNGDGTCYLKGIGTCTDTDIIIPSKSPAGDTVTSIGHSAFNNCSGLTSIEIPAGVTSIGNFAFEDCSGLTSIEIPAGVTSIGDYAFCNCSGLTSATFAEGSQIQSIGNFAFYNCSGLTSIEIPNGVASIGYRTFYNCSGLTSIEIPASVSSIEYGAFSGCSGLETINYTGTEEQWNAITKGDYWDENAGSSTEKGTYTIVYKEELILAEKLFSNINEGLTLETKNTIVYKNTTVHLNYLDIIKLNNPSNIKSGKTLFGITGTNTGNAPDKQAAVVIHDGYNTNIYPFYGNDSYLQNITWTVNADKIIFSDGQYHTCVKSTSILGLSSTDDYTISDDDLSVGETCGTLNNDQIVEYWVVYDEVLIERPSKQVKNILMIGNSFCNQFTEELYAIAAADGYELNIANLFKSGCSTQEHLTYLNNGAEVYTLYETSSNTKGVKTAKNVKTVQGALDYANSNFGTDWDVISLQQHFLPRRAASYNIGLNETQSYAKSLYDYIKTNHSESIPVWHQTWAYEVGYGVPENYAEGVAVPEYQVSSARQQLSMHNNIKKVSQVVATDSGINLIPSGDAWKIARANSLIGTTLCERLGINNDMGDYFHDGDIGGGQYLNACVWYEVLMGESCMGNTWRPTYELSEEKITALQEAAHQAVAAVYGPSYCKEYEPITTTVHFKWNDDTPIGTAVTTAAKPYLFGGGGHGDGLGIYLGAKVFADEGYTDEPPYEDHFYTSVVYYFTGLSFEKTGEYFDSWYPLTAGETYTVYVHHDDELQYGDTPTTLTVYYHTYESDDYNEYFYSDSKTVTTYVANPEVSIATDDAVGNYGIKFGDQLVSLYTDGGTTQIVGFLPDDRSFTESITEADLLSTIVVPTGSNKGIDVLSDKQLYHQHYFSMFDETTYDPCRCGCSVDDPAAPPEIEDHVCNFVDSGTTDESGQPISYCSICGQESHI